MRLVVLGGGESVGTAILGKKKGYVFVSDFGKIKDKYKKDLIDNNIDGKKKDIQKI
jgi:UDP-N-acetylmuramoylalanine--D-glutamate ligase